MWSFGLQLCRPETSTFEQEKALPAQRKTPADTLLLDYSGALYGSDTLREREGERGMQGELEGGREGERGREKVCVCVTERGRGAERERG